jgi:hypothetical protein
VKPHQSLELRKALRFLDEVSLKRQAIELKLTETVPAIVTATTHRAFPALTPEEEDTSYAESERLCSEGQTADAMLILSGLADRGALRWEVYNDLGTMLINEGRGVEGLRALKMAASLEFSSTHSLRNLIVACVQQGEIANALAACGLLLRIEPHNPDIPAFLRDLLLEANPRLDDYAWLSDSLSKTLEEHTQLVARVAAEAPQVRRFEIKAELFDWCKDIPQPTDQLGNSTLWSQPPPAINHRNQTSCIVFLPPTCGGVSVYRILSALTPGYYHYLNFEVEAHQANDPYKGELSAMNGYAYDLAGSIYSWREANRLEESLHNSALCPSDLRHMIILRDPRDSLVSLYHILRDPQYVPPKELSAFQDRNRLEKERLASISLDDYVLESASYWSQNITKLADLLTNVPATQIEFLSYAVLCEDFPAFLHRLVSFLQIMPTRKVYDELLKTEDVKRKDTLRSSSMARLSKAAPLPGRHKRELRPETIIELNKITATARQWMASLEVPEFRHLYDD